MEIVFLLSIIFSVYAFDDDRLDYSRAEARRQFWSSSCSARGININTPSTSAILFYISLVTVGVAIFCYSYRTCLRMVSRELRQMQH
ncbi:envelope glycoprotein N [Canid alphaherpesvirus 1]|uniref:Envelope glycoprotein N n=1 Tax=Canid alphaherpesvirus 1 TaxID=170325 RepID=A0A172DSW0_9ALPH|nr:envelope glycoprotein N [Canid alphaherpesvirus 1]ALL25886.1 envelope glycoprotein N [Canid alphaherpesvirus 1]ALL25966.1 envelope glycoprotein N [Canid alphaherpesvirus 1]ALL26042.1 envelope glycoprotein N [Canid alphaherpesvirus 1]AQX83323.1 envelope glycoprotein N [Canid alphaherpesvirus 1]ARE29814.1 envelope glycoprotein N [Canid alphaherpesvirus 1]